MSHRYTIGGAAFTTSDALPDLETGGPADTEFTAIFADIDEFRVAFDTGALPVVGPQGLVGVMDVDDRRCRILHEDANPDERAWLLKQLAPMFSAILGKLVLHASAVEVDGSVIGFIGGTGVGKSTLAAYLNRLGHREVSDDLLPVRFSPEPTALTLDGLVPITTLCFLERDSIDEVHTTSMDAATALKAHIANGFGEHRHPDTWASQFDGYHRLVEAIPHYDLVVPDDLDAMPAVTRAVLRLMEASDAASSEPL